MTGQEQIYQKVAHQAAKGRFGRARQCSHITRAAHWRLSASAPDVGHETGYDEDVAVITHQVGSSFEAEHEARCDGDVPPKGTDGSLETTHTDEAASSERLNLGRRRRTERTASPTRHARAGHRIRCFGRVGRRRAMLGACAPDPGTDLLAAVATGGTPRRVGGYGSHLQG